LEVYCKKKKLYLPGIRDKIENAIWRRVDCECEILNDQKQVKRKRLWVMFDCCPLLEGGTWESE